MKKTTLFILLIAFACTVNAQVTLWEDNFDSYTPTTNVGEVIDIPADFAQYDVDGDTYSWGLTQLTNWSTNQQAEFDRMYTNNWITSASFVTDLGVNGNLGIGALTPNNILVLPQMSVPSDALNVNLTYYVGSGSAATFFSETYSVTVTSSNAQADILAETPELSTTLTFQGGEEITINLDAFIGDDIYIAFRHHDTNDEFILGLDDIRVTYDEALSIDDLQASKIKHTFNQTTKILKVEAQNALNTVSVFNILGQEILIQRLNNSIEELDMSKLQSGLYIVKISDNTNANKTIKLLVK
jgi:hypothetical protein